MTERVLELVLFENEVDGARRFSAAGISSFMIDTEVLGKDLRQMGFDTEIRPGTTIALKEISGIPLARPWCRLNRHGDQTASEVEEALAAGAAVLLLPMVTALAEVESFLELIGGRCEAGIMIETQEAAALAVQLNRLPLDCVFFGLNDFAISRGGGSLFRALADGSVEAVRRAFTDVRFGVGGLTDLRRGHPIPSSRLLEEIQRLDCDFTFLRRSFRRDSASLPPAEIVHEIHRYWRQCARRDAAERLRDHEALVAIINRLEA